MNKNFQSWAFQKTVFFLLLHRTKIFFPVFQLTDASSMYCCFEAYALMAALPTVRQCAAGWHREPTHLLEGPSHLLESNTCAFEVALVVTELVMRQAVSRIPDFQFYANSVPQSGICATVSMSITFCSFLSWKREHWVTGKSKMYF